MFQNAGTSDAEHPRLPANHQRTIKTRADNGIREYSEHKDQQNCPPIAGRPGEPLPTAHYVEIILNQMNHHLAIGLGLEDVILVTSSGAVLVILERRYDHG